MRDKELLRLYEVVVCNEKCTIGADISLNRDTVNLLLDCIEELGKYRKLPALGYKGE
jgi:hypothetical protein